MICRRLVLLITVVVSLAACSSNPGVQGPADYEGTWIRVINATPDVLAVGIVEPRTERVRPYAAGLLPGGWAKVPVEPSDVRAGGTVVIGVRSQKVRAWVALKPVRILDPGGDRTDATVRTKDTVGIPRGQTRGVL